MSGAGSVADFEPGQILRALEAHHVRYVVIGAIAAIAAGAPILTTDLDVTPERSDENLERLALALRDLDANAGMLDGSNSGTLATRAGDLGLWFAPAGTRGYEDLRSGATRERIAGVIVAVAALADVIRSKKPPTARRTPCSCRSSAGRWSRLRVVDADAVELRVLGCLIEKQLTTPDQYPLSLNALRLAANQSTNREPVVDYDEATIRAALERLGDRGWTRLASGPGSRAVKFRHLFDTALELSGPQVALLAVLMLRGPQTTAELRARSERLHPFATAEAVEVELGALARRELVQRLSRRPGERGERWQQLLGADAEESPAADAAPAPAAPSRLAELEERIAAIEARLDAAGL